MNWIGKTKRIATEFEVMLNVPLERRNNSQNQHKIEPLDFNFECRCYGSHHPQVNMCRTCGRIICALEGERPCPFCGTIILSEETLAAGDAEVLGRKRVIEDRMKELEWVPLSGSEETLAAHEMTLDLDIDWFDKELMEIFDTNVTEEL
jgi:hypothetical protein